MLTKVTYVISLITYVFTDITYVYIRYKCNLNTYVNFFCPIEGAVYGLTTTPYTAPYTEHYSTTDVTS